MRSAVSSLKQPLASVRPLVWLLLLTSASLLPFAKKAFHIDDTLFLRAAEQIQNQPTDPYGFNINWYGVTMPMVKATENPPLTSYYIALMAAIVGWQEWTLHVVFLFPALAAIWGIYSLAQQHCNCALLATTIAAISPVFLISATTLMCDVMLLAFWVWSLVLFERGLQRTASGQRFSVSAFQLFLASGLLAGLAVLTKFMAVALVPLVLAFGLVRQRRGGTWMIAALIPIIFAGLYEWVNHSLYGEGWILKAASYSVHAQSVFGTDFVDKGLRGLLFTGGCFLPVLFCAPWIWPRRSLWWGMGCGAAVVCLLPFSSTLAAVLWGPAKEMNWGLFLQSGMFLIGGLHILLLAGTDYWVRRDASSLLLLLWTLGIFVFASFVNWTINGRSLLPMLPAAGILVARRLEDYLVKRDHVWRFFFSRKLWLPLVPAALLSLLLVKADYDLAGASRTAARYLCAKYQAREGWLWFEGHWGFQYYMEQLGAKPLDFQYHKLVPGEVVVLPAPSTFAPALPPGLAEPVETSQYISPSQCSTMTYSGTAAFYCGLYGPLPFVFGQADPATFSVYQVKRADERGELKQLIEAAPTEDEIKKLQARLAAHPNDANAHFQLAIRLSASSRTAEAIAHYREGLRLTPDSPEGLNNLAWILATDADAKLRNGAEAVQLAARACEKTGSKKPVMLGTLAASYAEAGRFGEAVATAQKAIELAEAAGQPDLAAINRRLLEMYRANRPYHQDSPRP